MGDGARAGLVPHEAVTMGALIRNDRIRFQRWRECAVCGFEYPENQMVLRRGSYVCTEHDRDTNLIVEEQPFDLTRRKEERTWPEWPRK